MLISLGDRLPVDVKIVNGGYRGQISEDGAELRGEWTEHRPLVHRAALATRPTRRTPSP